MHPNGSKSPFDCEFCNVTAMVGLLQAIPGTKLHQRLRRQGRLLGGTTGNNVDGTTNFIPQMNRETLRQGYQSLMAQP